MDLTIDQSALSRALRLVARVAPARPTPAILQAVRLECAPGRLTLAATDSELGVVATLAADVAAPGRTALPARLLGEYVAQLPAEPLRLTLDAGGNRARVVSGRHAASFATLPPEDFPDFPAPDPGSALEFDAAQLRGAIERVAFAAARDSSRPVLSTVLFDLGIEGLTVVAADGFRLARATLPRASGTSRQLLVPARAAAELGRLLADGATARLSLTADARGVFLDVRETTLFARLVEGRYPDVDRLIPQAWRTRATVEAASFRQAVRVAGLFGAGEARPVVVEAMPGRLRLHARGDEAGEAECALEAEVEGESQAVALNTRLLVDLLDAIRTPQLELTWTDPQTPVVLREVGGAASGLAIVMPIWDPALIRREAVAA
jgi:DNA polymerase-3 subunit beta